MELSSHQCRAARSLLNWSQDEMARNANVSRATVIDFEAFNRTPMKNNLRSIAECLFAAGIEMIPEDGDRGVGVRFRTQKIEYSKNVQIDRFSSRAVMKMRFGGEDFLCHVDLNAIDDFHRTDFKTDEEFSKGLSDILHIVVSAAERYAPIGIKDGVLCVDYEMIAGEG